MNETMQEVRKLLELPDNYHHPLPANNQVMQSFQNFKDSAFGANVRENLGRLGIADDQAINGLMWAAYSAGYINGYHDAYVAGKAKD